LQYHDQSTSLAQKSSPFSINASAIAPQVQALPDPTTNNARRGAAGVGHVEVTWGVFGEGAELSDGGGRAAKPDTEGDTGDAADGAKLKALELETARHGSIMFVHDGNLQPSCCVINDALRHYGT